jgi:DNA-binding MarR family transcriptional regulator
MKLYSPSDLDYNLWFTIRRTHEAIHTLRRAEMRKIRLSPIESGVLFVINEAKNKITPAEISRQLFKDPNSISQLLGRMEKRGLIKNIKGFRQKHMVQVKLTEKGQSAFKLSQSGSQLKKILGVLSDKEKMQLIKCFDKLRNKASEEMS